MHTDTQLKYNFSTYTNPSKAFHWPSLVGEEAPPLWLHYHGLVCKSLFSRHFLQPQTASLSPVTRPGHPGSLPRGSVVWWGLLVRFLGLQTAETSPGCLNQKGNHWLMGSRKGRAAREGRTGGTACRNEPNRTPSHLALCLYGPLTKDQLPFPQAGRHGINSVWALFLIHQKVSVLKHVLGSNLKVLGRVVCPYPGPGTRPR